jgi:hypothetical protein
MESALLVDVDVACSGLRPRVSVMVGDSGSFCFLSGSKRAFISLSTGLSYQCKVMDCEKIHFNSEVPRLTGYNMYSRPTLDYLSQCQDGLLPA